jgi:hypothetical protein
MNKGYKYRSASDLQLKTLSSNKIWLPVKAKLNDPCEGYFDDSEFTNFFQSNPNISEDSKRIFTELRDAIDRKGIFSLSQDICNDLLWAHYGDEHQGFAIEYDLDLMCETFNYSIFTQVIKVNVNYSNTPPILRLKDYKNQEAVIECLIGTKSESWKYEQEVRLVFEQTGELTIDDKAITAIYFGLRMPPNKKEEIMNLLQGRGIQYFEMTNKLNSYLFEPRALVDKFKAVPTYKGNNLTYNKSLLSEVYLGKYVIYKQVIEEVIDKLCAMPMIKSIETIGAIGPIDDPIFSILTRVDSQPMSIKTFKYKLNSMGKLNLLRLN